MKSPSRVIAEDEAVVARRIARLTEEILGPRAGAIAIVPRVDEARAAIEQAPPDLLPAPAPSSSSCIRLGPTGGAGRAG
jgi:hypothetical protein